ncbi:MAG: 50S ribosomal protein L32 [Candidatus Moraniibacteriota bacterium]|nr:MAG: 50S ribosomal protein L32 [Candidatus Moranbacteria bacterium]
MALPKQRHTHHRRDRARKFLELTPVVTAKCPKCQAEVLPHRACKECGHYKGREVVKTTPKMKTAKAA